MKNCLRTISLILALLMLSSCMNATKDNETPESLNTVQTDGATEAAEESAAFIPDSLEAANFDGYEFVVGSYIDGDHSTADILFYGEVTGERVRDTLNQNRIAVEDRFGVTLSKLDSSDYNALKRDAEKSILADEDVYSLIFCRDQDTISLGKSGYLYNLSNIEQFDYSKPWWPELALEPLTLCGKLFAASNYMSYVGLAWTRVVMMNKDLAADIKMEVPYDTVRNGDWTLDTLNTLITDVSYDLDGDGVINGEKDIVGLTPATLVWFCLQESFGVTFYEKDENDAPQLNIDLAKTELMISKLRELTSHDYYKADYKGHLIFKEGRSLFALTMPDQAYKVYRNGEMSYAFLPAPKLDENQENYINCSTDLLWGIPRNVTEEEANIIGTIVEALSCLNYNYALPAYFETTLKTRLADAPEDAEMLQLIADTRSIGFAFNYSLEFCRIVEELLDTYPNAGVASHIEKKRQSAKKAIEDLVEKFTSPEFGQ